MKLAIPTSIILASIASAATLPIRNITLPARTGGSAEDPHPAFFPRTAQSHTRRTQMTNAELLQRGLPLAKPARLYDTVALAKRVVNAAPLASTVPAAGATSGSYIFAGCANNFEYGDNLYVVSGTLQQQANECAARSRADGPAIGYGDEKFIIIDGNLYGSSSSNCFTQVTGFSESACSLANAAIYLRVR